MCKFKSKMTIDAITTTQWRGAVHMLRSHLIGSTIAQRQFSISFSKECSEPIILPSIQLTPQHVIGPFQAKVKLKLKSNVTSSPDEFHDGDNSKKKKNKV